MAKAGWRARKRVAAAQRAAELPGPRGYRPPEPLAAQQARYKQAVPSPEPSAAPGGGGEAAEMPWSGISMPERMVMPPLHLRAAALRVPLAQVLAGLSQLHAGLQDVLSKAQLSDHPNAAKLFGALAEADVAFARFYNRVGVALACVAPGEEQ